MCCYMFMLSVQINVKKVISEDKQTCKRTTKRKGKKTVPEKKAHKTVWGKTTRVRLYKTKGNREKK